VLFSVPGCRFQALNLTPGLEITRGVSEGDKEVRTKIITWWKKTTNLTGQLYRSMFPHSYGGSEEEYHSMNVDKINFGEKDLDSLSPSVLRYTM